LSFLPALRTAVSGGSRSAERKQLGFADYYAGLLVAGINIDAASARKRWSMERAVTEGFERAIWCYKPVDAIAREHLRTPFSMSSNGNKIPDHPYYRLLNTGFANPMETAAVFRKRLVQQFLLSPRGVFVEETPSRSGAPARLDLLSPARTRIIPGTGAELIAYYETTGADGIRRFVDPERVRWIRDPHPTDPFGAMTPLEAAGLSIELDYFARLYNVSFMRNDARPGGILGINGDMDDADMDRIEAKFGKGPVEAGRLTAIAGEVSYVDIAARPRDVQYQVLSRIAREEILAAFGVPMTVLGQADGKTYANADAEIEVFWMHTMTSVNALIASGFSNDDMIEVSFDHSKIPAMQRAEQAARAEAKGEVEGGLRSIDEYRGLRDDLPPLDNAFTRALWLQSGKTPVPAKPEDGAELGLGTPVDPNAPVDTSMGGAPDPAAAGQQPNDSAGATTDPAAPPAAPPAAGPIPGAQPAAPAGGTDANGDAIIPAAPANVTIRG
jgi:HK97 family phage portal protein